MIGDLLLMRKLLTLKRMVKIMGRKVKVVEFISSQPLII
jgi:hypothetical protein